MARGLVNIIDVQDLGGSPPKYRLTVDDTTGVLPGDHLGARLSNNAGAIYLALIVTPTTIDVEDSLTDAEAGEFGLPTTGTGGYGTPGPTNNLTQFPFGSPGWDAAVRRNNSILDNALTSLVTLGDIILDNATVTAGGTIIGDGPLTIGSTTDDLTLNATTSDVVISTLDTNRWRFLSTGHFVAEVDNTYDIGTSGATRPRTGYFGTSVVVGDTVTVGSSTVTGSVDLTLTGTNDLFLVGTNITSNASNNLLLNGVNITSTASNDLMFDATSGSVFLKTAGTSRWQVDNSGNLVAFADNTYDIGASGANRPGVVHVADSVIVGSTVTIDTDSVTGSNDLLVGAAPTSLGDLVLFARGGSIDLNEAGNESLDASSFGAVSIIGALNELKAEIEASGTLQETLLLGNDTGGSNVVITAGDEIVFLDHATAGIRGNNDGSRVNVTGGSSTTTGGNVNIVGGSVVASNVGNGGDVNITGGNGGDLAGSDAGYVIISGGTPTDTQVGSSVIGGTILFKTARIAAQAPLTRWEIDNSGDLIPHFDNTATAGSRWSSIGNSSSGIGTLWLGGDSGLATAIKPAGFTHDLEIIDFGDMTIKPKVRSGPAPGNNGFSVNISGGDHFSQAADGGDVNITGGDLISTGHISNRAGSVFISGGNLTSQTPGENTSLTAGDVIISSGISDPLASAGGTGGFVQINTGTGTTSDPRWRFDNAGHFFALDDDTYDIGFDDGPPASGRPRKVFVGTEVVVGDSISITTDAIGCSTNLSINPTGSVTVNGDFNIAGGGTVTGVGLADVLAEDNDTGSNQLRISGPGIRLLAGSITFDSSSETITGPIGGDFLNIRGGTATGSSGGVQIVGGNTITGGAGGDITIAGGNVTGFNVGTGGDVNITGGTHGQTGSAASGTVIISGGNRTGSGVGGDIIFQTAPTGVPGSLIARWSIDYASDGDLIPQHSLLNIGSINDPVSNIYLDTALVFATGSAGIVVQSGSLVVNAAGVGTAPQKLRLVSGTGTSVAGADLEVTAGSSVNSTGGDVVITAGAGSTGSGADPGGNVSITGGFGTAGNNGGNVVIEGGGTGSGTEGKIFIGTSTGTIGFFGATPVTQSAAYTRTATVIEDRTLLASASATATNNNNVLAALIADLQALGLIG